MSDIYTSWCNQARITTEHNLLNNFKSNINVTDMLEHVSYDQGQKYLDIIFKQINKIPIQDIISYCELNDKIGGGLKYNYSFITTSPSNFRYILHSHLILTHMKSKNNNEVNIVEVGGGYGGLCLALNHFSKLYDINIKTYNIVDLPEIINLQRLYLSNFNLSFDLKLHNAYQYGSTVEDTNLFLISNYAFSEISNENQQNYIKTLFGKVSHGFMTWNMIPVYNFGFDYTEEIEYPLTGPFNKYVYF
jgi:hypothetical protein